MKAIATLMGIKYANANYPCPWCTWKTIKTNEKVLKVYDGRVWSMRNPDFGARLQSDAQELYKKNKIEESMGYTNPPIIDYIEYHNVAVDLLHVCLRVTGKFHKLIYSLRPATSLKHEC